MHIAKSGVSHQRAGDHDKALSLYHRALQLSEHNVEALVAELPNLEELHVSVSKASDDCAACCSLGTSVPKGCKVQFVAALPKRFSDVPFYLSQGR